MSIIFFASTLEVFRIAIKVLLGICVFAFVSSNANSAQVTLTWDASSEANLAGYMVYYGERSGVYGNKIDVGNVSTHALANLTEGKQYFYAVTAYDVARVESPYSNEASSIAPSAKPVAAFNSDKATAIAPATFAFTNSSSGTITAYQWDFGDGTSGTSRDVSHSYTKPGTYQVRLTATGPSGSANATKTINVIAAQPTPTQNLIANFVANKTTVAVGEPVTFTNTSTAPATIALWYFGDYRYGQGLATQSHVYKTPGIYTVMLKVTNDKQSNTKTMARYILVTGNSTATTNFQADVTTGPAPLTVTFTATTSSAKASYYWRFGDGAVGSGQRVNHVYNKSGRYAVTLMTTTPAGNFTTTKQNFITAQSALNKPGLVAAYNFDTGSGTTLADLAGKNIGLIRNATWSNTGRHGKSLYFNGVNSWVTVQPSASLNLTSGMTLEAWVRPTDAQRGWTDIIMKEKPEGLVYYLTANSDDNVPVGGAFIGGVERAIKGKSTLPVNVWSHIATTYDGATQKFYLNGTLIASRAQSGVIQTSTGALRIGGDSIWGEYFKGMIDDVRIYNRALSNSEVQGDLLSPVSN